MKLKSLTLSLHHNCVGYKFTLNQIYNMKLKWVPLPECFIFFGIIPASFLRLVQCLYITFQGINIL